MSACGFYRHLTSDCPRSLSGAKLTWLSYRKMSANDPKRTFVHLGILPFKRATLNFGYDFADCSQNPSVAYWFQASGTATVYARFFTTVYARFFKWPL